MSNYMVYDPLALFDDVWWPSTRAQTGKADPRVRAKRTADGFEVEFIVPGFKKEELEIVLSEGQLEVAGRNSRWPDCNFSYYVGKSVESKHLTAVLENGILMVRVVVPSPEAEISKTRVEIL